MEPVTHILTGACLSRSGLNRRAAYTTLAMAIGAELPDIDTLWSLRGPVNSFQHHRGITHTFIAIPVEAAVVVGGMFLLHRWRLRKSAVTTAAPVNWLLLYGFTLLALLSHIFLDFTNNYGVRPFFPFNPHWYAASIVFIFDPLIFALLLFALAIPSIFRLVSSEVGARRKPFASRGFSLAALVLISSLYVFREVQHNHAVQIAMGQTVQAPVPVAPGGLVDENVPAPEAPTPVYLQAQRSLANPDPFNPFRWYTVTDFGPLYQLGEVSTRTETFVPGQALLTKPAASTTLRAAQDSQLGHAYLDWSSMPVVTVTPASELGLDDEGNRVAAGHTLVTFSDPRFMGDVPILHARGHTPLTGTVELDAQNHVVAEKMDGSVQRR